MYYVCWKDEFGGVLLTSCWNVRVASRSFLSLIHKYCYVRDCFLLTCTRATLHSIGEVELFSYFMQKLLKHCVVIVFEDTSRATLHSTGEVELVSYFMQKLLEHFVVFVFEDTSRVLAFSRSSRL